MDEFQYTHNSISIVVTFLGSLLFYLMPFELHFGLAHVLGNLKNPVYLVINDH